MGTLFLFQISLLQLVLSILHCPPWERSHVRHSEVAKEMWCGHQNNQQQSCSVLGLYLRCLVLCTSIPGLPSHFQFSQLSYLKTIILLASLWLRLTFSNSSFLVWLWTQIPVTSPPHSFSPCIEAFTLLLHPLNYDNCLFWMTYCSQPSTAGYNSSHMFSTLFLTLASLALLILSTLITLFSN